MTQFELVEDDLLRWLEQNRWLAQAESADYRFHACMGDPPYFLASIVKRFGSKDAAKAQFGKDGAFQRQSKGFMGKCYHPDTEILTEHGWKNIREVVESKYAGEAYTLNMTSGEIEMSQIVDHQQFRYDGDLIHFDSRSIDLLVTPNHNLVVSELGGIAYRRADDSRNVVQMLSQGIWDTPRTTPMIDVGEKIYPIEPLFRFLGIYLGDGCVVHRKNQPEKQDFISISTCIERKKRAIRVVCDELGLKYAEYDKQTIIYNKAFNQWLTPLGHAHEKYIPEWVFSHDTYALNELWQGLLSTDGHSGKNGTIIQYSTTSKRLADDVQRLLLLCGLSGTCHFREPRGFASERGCYVISAHKRNKILWFERVDHKTGKMNSKPYPYHGMVYDVTVKDNHTLFVRRNGRAVWSSNSWDGFEDVWAYQAWVTEWATMLLDYIYPGGVLAMFGGTRTVHRLAAGLEDAGWEIFDEMLAWNHSTGFPKSADIGSLIGKSQGYRGPEYDQEGNMTYPGDVKSAEHEAYEGFKTYLKPSYEPIVLARAPRQGYGFADMALQFNSGALNIDAARIPYVGDVDPRTFSGTWSQSTAGKEVYAGGWNDDERGVSTLGRYPANTILICSCENETHDPGCPVAEMDRQSGMERRAGGNLSGKEPAEPTSGVVYDGNYKRHTWESYGDIGGASRFLLNVKATTWEREAGLEDFTPRIVNDGREKNIDNAYQRGTTPRKNSHPTIKPLGLTTWLASLLLPPAFGQERRILVPFAGSGSEMIGAHLAGWDTIVGIEREAEYCAINRARTSWWSGFSSFEEGKQAYDARITAKEQEDAGQLRMF